MGGGGWGVGEVPKKYSRKGKLNKKLPLIQIVNKLITNNETQDNNNNLRVTT